VLLLFSLSGGSHRPDRSLQAASSRSHIFAVHSGMSILDRAPHSPRGLRTDQTCWPAPQNPSNLKYDFDDGKAKNDEKEPGANSLPCCKPRDGSGIIASAGFLYRSQAILCTGFLRDGSRNINDEERASQRSVGRSNHPLQIRPIQQPERLGRLAQGTLLEIPKGKSSSATDLSAFLPPKA
jgi:hypothetical protein